MILTLKNSCVLKIVLFACLINLFVSNEGVSQNAVLLFLFSLASAVNIKLLEAFSLVTGATSRGSSDTELLTKEGSKALCKALCAFFIHAVNIMCGQLTLGQLAQVGC